jgi:hypothetical protein
LFADLFPADATKDDIKAAFDGFMGTVALHILPYLTLVRSRMHSWCRGGMMPLAKVICGNWSTEAATKSVDSYVVRDPNWFFETHIEVGVQIGRPTLVVFVSFEPVPFIPETKFKAMAAPETVRLFDLRRKAFKAAFSRECGLLILERRLPPVHITNDCTMVGKITYDFTGRTVAEVRDWLAPVIDDVACVINAAVLAIDARRRGDAQDHIPPFEPNLVLDFGPATVGAISEPCASERREEDAVANPESRTNPEPALWTVTSALTDAP